MIPYRIPACAGKPFRPSNGTECDIFQTRFCECCVKDAEYRRTDDNGCPIIANSICYDVDDPNYPQEWTHTAEGDPTCTAFEAETAS